MGDPVSGGAGGSKGSAATTKTAGTASAPLYKISYSGTGFSGTSPVNYSVGSSTTFDLPSVTGYQWKLQTYGLKCGSTTSPFTQDQTDTYSGNNQNLNNVYGDIAFTTVANSWNVTMKVTQTRGDGTAGSGNTVKVNNTAVANNGTKAADYATSVALTQTAATGYYFVDFTSSDVIIAADKTFTMPDKDVTVTATFKEKQYTIVYDKTSANNTTIASQTKYHLSDVVLSSTVPVKAGHTFLGWSTTSGATTAQFKPGARVPAASLNGTNNGDNVSLYGVFKANDYTVTIDPSICGGTVSAQGSAKAGDDVTLTIEMDEGYTGLNELYYTVDGGAATNIDQGTKKFTMPAGNVTVFASFRGEYMLKLDGSSISGGKLLIGKTELGEAEVGRKVKLSVDADDNKKLVSVSYQRVTSATGSTRAPADITIEGKNTISASDSRVEYFSQQGVYVITIDGVDSNLRVTAEFEEKTDLSSASVDLEGVSSTYPAGSAPDDAGWYAIVGGQAQQTGVDVSLTYTMSNSYEVGSKGSITVTALPNNKDYQGSKAFADQFTMVKQAPAAYTIDAIPSVEYSGSAQKPAVVVRKDGTAMGVSNYTLSYSNNTNAGTATVQAKVSDATDGECYVTQTFLINRKDLTIKPTGTQSLTYGQDLVSSTGAVTATGLASGDVLSAITLSAPSINAGSYTMTVSGAVVKTSDGSQFRTDNYNITYTNGTVTIAAATATLQPGDLTVTYGDPVPGLDAYSLTAGGLQYSDQLGEKPSTMSTNYTRGSAVGSSYPISCGTGTPTIKAGTTNVTSNYTFTRNNGTLTVRAFDLRDAYIVVSDNEKGYNGGAQTATVKVYTAETDGYEITGDCDVWYGDTQLGQTVATSQTLRGAYPITVKPKDGNQNVTGQKEAEESFVIGLKSITSETGGTGYDVGMSGPTKTYTGSPIEPTLDELTVSYAGSTLSSDQKTTEFEISGYSNNVNVGTGKVSIASRNVNFSGIRGDVEFAITAADLSASGAINATDTKYAPVVNTSDGRSATPEASGIKVPYQGAAFKLNADDIMVYLNGGSNALPTADYKIRYKKDGTTYDTIDDIGTYTIVIAAGESGNTTSEGETTLTVETQREIVVTKNEWVTYYDGRYDLQKPEGYDVYYVTAVNEASRQVTVAALDYIPSNVPVLLRNAAYASNYSDEKVTLTVSASATGSAPTGTCSDFYGIGTEPYVAADGSTDYIVVRSQFVKAEPGSEVEEHRCYLRLADTAGARSFTIVFDDATGLGAIDNGQTNDSWYDMQGRKIVKLSNRQIRPGLYIKNGKKTVVK